MSNIEEEADLTQNAKSRKRMRKRGHCKTNGGCQRRNDKRTTDYRANQKRLEHIEFIVKILNVLQ